MDPLTLFKLDYTFIFLALIYPYIGVQFIVAVNYS